jgi:hypothetical protein
MPSLFFFGRGLSVHFGLFWCGCLVALLDFFSGGLCVEKNANVPPNALALEWQS